MHVLGLLQLRYVGYELEGTANSAAKDKPLAIRYFTSTWYYLPVPYITGVVIPENL
jgi:hypothetical protein